MRATLERDANRAERGDDNLPIEPRFEVLAVVPCWIFTASESERIDGRRTTNIEGLRMLMPRGTDVLETDRISRIEDRAGVVQRDGVLEIQAVIDRHDHLELSLTSVQ